MEDHPIQGLMTTAMENLKDMIEVNTIIGDPVESPDGTIIIPISKVGFGFAAGGTEFNSSEMEMQADESTLPFGGGSGGGVSIKPVAFLIVREKDVQVVHLNENTHIYEKLIEQTPEVIKKIKHIIGNTSQSKENLNYDI